jgi:hypothetical protein
MIEYLDPSGELAHPPALYHPRPMPTDRSPRIAMLSNCIVDATAFLADFAAAMAVHMNMEFGYFDKGGLRFSTFPYAQGKIEHLAVNYDAVVTGLGHCGSCTAGTIRDAVALAKLGVPVVALVTEKFEEEANFIAIATGIAELPIYVLPHPISGRSADYHRRLSEEHAEAVLGLLSHSELLAVVGRNDAP